ncbi:MAG: DUF2961 domain-containing protein [Planctomycetes bacterium]|nr:DUF2961 domain-containing protein [Planctomycetota bacterium]
MAGRGCLDFGLGNIALLADEQSRSISAENPNGAKGGGAKAKAGKDSASSLLGLGWKCRPCITIPKGKTVTLAEVKGPGVIRHIWITVSEKAYRSHVLRIYWDGEKTPSVEVPLGDFFCCPHAKRTKVLSLPINVNPSGGFNSYWPMPFRKHAKITVENQYWDDQSGFFYQVDYALTDVPKEAAYFHAQFRMGMTTRENPDFVVLDGVKGKGHYVGTALGWNQFSDGWWGEGEMKFYLDGDGKFPTICTTGTEDYFGGAWCFKDTFSAPFLGYPMWEQEPNKHPKHGLYRWHIMDPIRFDHEIRATMQALGWWQNRKYEPLTDELSSVAYWYQAEPHAAFPKLPDMKGRAPR